MRSFISIPLAALFVFLAGLNAWIMLTGAGSTPRSRTLWTRVHRICGYSFIALYAIFCYFMLLRIRGSADELSPRLILHMGLALMLPPLLLVKVMVARFQKASWSVLIGLGTGIFVTAFTMVSVNITVHYLRLAEHHKVPLSTSLGVVAVIVSLAAIAFFLKTQPSNPTSVE